MRDACIYQPGEPLPGNLFELIGHSTGRPFIERPQTSAGFAAFAAVCNYSFVATLIYALRCTPLIDDTIDSASDAPDAPAPLTVHILGVNTEVVMFSASECWLLMRWLPTRHQRIDLRFFGAQLPAKRANIELSYAFGERMVRCRFDRVSYVDMDETVPGWQATPDLCIAYNAGFTNSMRSGEGQSDAAKNPWLPTIERLVRTCRLVALTEYVFEEQSDDISLLKGMLLAAGGTEPRYLAFGQNPYRDGRPYRDPMCHLGWGRSGPLSTVYYVNGFLCVLEFRGVIGGGAVEVSTIAIFMSNI